MDLVKFVIFLSFIFAFISLISIIYLLSFITYVCMRNFQSNIQLHINFLSLFVAIFVISLLMLGVSASNYYCVGIRCL